MSSEPTLDRRIAALAAVAALAGSLVGSASTFFTATYQVRQEQASADRAKRAAIYADVLAKADTLRDHHNVTFRYFNRVSLTPAETETARTARTAAIAAMAELRAALANVYVYGSDSGLRAARTLVDDLYDWSRESRLVSGRDDLTDLTFDSYEGHYQELLKVMCEEVPNRPRSECGYELRENPPWR